MFAGLHALYMMLDTWSPGNVGRTGRMVDQGKRVVRAAVAAGVAVVLHSGGPTTDPFRHPSAMCNGERREQGALTAGAGIGARS